MSIRCQEFEKAARIRDEEQKIKNELEKMKNDWNQKNQTNTDTVDGEDIAEIVSSWTGIPVKRLAEEESERLLKMEEVLHTRVIGQDEAVKAVSRAIRRSRVGLKGSKTSGWFIHFSWPQELVKLNFVKLWQKHCLVMKMR